MGTTIHIKNPYVHFEHLESHIFRTLENRNGPTVVLLHVNVGTGKSTLARALLQHYSEPETSLFEFVIFVHCHSSMDFPELVSELMERLGHTSLAGSGMKDQVTNQLANRKALLILDDLSNGKVLHDMVNLCGAAVKCLVTSQDADLCQSESFPSRYIGIPMQKIDGDTAQRVLASYSGLSSQMIPAHLKEVIGGMIDSTELDLMALVSIGSMINKARNNELDEWMDVQETFSDALVTIPISVINQHCFTQSFWATTRLAIESLSEDATKLLFLAYACEGPNVPDEILQVFYKSRKFTRASVSFSKAKSELENLHLVKVVKLGHADFPLDVTVSMAGNPRSCWSLHSLHKQYIKMEMQNDVDAIFSQSLHCHDGNVCNCEGNDRGDSEAAAIRAWFKEAECVDEEMLHLLCALYLRWPFPLNVISGLQIFPFNLLARDTLRHEIRNVIQPIILSLGRANCPQRSQRLVKEVSVAFFRKSTHLCPILQAQDEKKWLNLLKFPTTSSPAWTALKRMFAFHPCVYGFTMHMQTSLRLHKAMLVRLQLADTCTWREGVDNDRVRREQVEVVEVINCAGAYPGFLKNLLDTCDTLLSSPAKYCDSIMGALIHIIKQEHDVTLKTLCVRAIGNTMSHHWRIWYDHDQHTKIQSVATFMLDDLKEIFHDAVRDDGNSHFQASALRCLRKLVNLSLRGRWSTERSKVTIDSLKVTGEHFETCLLPELVRLLIKDAHSHIKQEVLKTVIVHIQGIDEYKMMFVKFPKAMDALGQLIHSTKGKLLRETLYLLVLLSKIPDMSLGMKIEATNGMVVDLLHIMNDDVAEDSEKNMTMAAEALIHLGVDFATDVTLSSSKAYYARSEAHSNCGMEDQALIDDEKARELDSTMQLDDEDEEEQEQANKPTLL